MTGPTTTGALINAILQQFAAGDKDAKEILVQRAYDRLLVISRGLLNQFPAVRREEETVTVLNEAYPRISKALDDVRPTNPRDFFGLAALQIRRVLLDLARKLSGRGADPRPGVVGGLGPAGDSGEHGSGHDPAESTSGLTSAGLKADVMDAVEKLSDEEREVVDLIFFNGLSQAEAASLLGVHEDTVKRRWAKVRIKLADMLEAYGLQGEAARADKGR